MATVNAIALALPIKMELNATTRVGHAIDNPVTAPIPPNPLPLLKNVKAIAVLERLAIVFYIILLMSFVAIGFRLYKYHNQKVFENKEGMLSIIATVTLNKKSRRIFILTFIGYGIFFL